jgi:hypothetical protein
MIDNSKLTVTMPLESFEEMKKEMDALRDAIKDRTITIASYYGNPYHIVNADMKLTELIKKINYMGIKIV